MCWDRVELVKKGVKPNWLQIEGGDREVYWVWCGFAVSSEVDLKNLLEDGIWDFQCLVLHQNYVIRVQIFFKSLFHLQREATEKRSGDSSSNQSSSSHSTCLQGKWTWLSSLKTMFPIFWGSTLKYSVICIKTLFILKSEKWHGLRIVRVFFKEKRNKG